MTIDNTHLLGDTASTRHHGPVLPVKVRDIMTKDPVTVAPSTTVRDIAHLFVEHDIRCVPVVEFNGLLVGVVTEADLVCREGYPTVRSYHLAQFLQEAALERKLHWRERTEGITAGEIMSADVVSCSPVEPVAMATRRMLQRGVRALPVVDDGQLVGILSTHDVVKLFDRKDPEIRKDVDAVLESPLWAPEGHHIEVEVLDGVAILHGTVRFHGDVSYIADIIKQVPGVVDVVVRLGWESPDPKPSYLHDTDWR